MCTRKNPGCAILFKGLERDGHAIFQESLIVFSVACTGQRKKGRASASLNYRALPPGKPMNVDLRKNVSLICPSFDFRYGLRGKESLLINSRLAIGQNGRCSHGA